MKINYSYHLEKKLCCGKEKQFSARINFTAINFPFCLIGCGDTKKEAKQNLLNKIQLQPEWMKKAIS